MTYGWLNEAVHPSLTLTVYGQTRELLTLPRRRRSSPASGWSRQTRPETHKQSVQI